MVLSKTKLTSIPTIIVVAVFVISIFILQIVAAKTAKAAIYTSAGEATNRLIAECAANRVRSNNKPRVKDLVLKRIQQRIDSAKKLLSELKQKEDGKYKHIRDNNREKFEAILEADIKQLKELKEFVDKSNDLSDIKKSYCFALYDFRIYSLRAKQLKTVNAYDAYLKSVDASKKANDKIVEKGKELDRAYANQPIERRAENSKKDIEENRQKLEAIYRRIVNASPETINKDPEFFNKILKDLREVKDKQKKIRLVFVEIEAIARLINEETVKRDANRRSTRAKDKTPKIYTAPVQENDDEYTVPMRIQQRDGSGHQGEVKKDKPKKNKAKRPARVNVPSTRFSFGPFPEPCTRLISPAGSPNATLFINSCY